MQADSALASSQQAVPAELPSTSSLPSLGRKNLKDLTTAESILLLDLVCHPNRIPLGSIKYRISGENLCHVKTPQDLSEIGLHFPRIILCSMAESIAKYQSEGVPLEIFPSTCSTSSKAALNDLSLSVTASEIREDEEAVTMSFAAVPSPMTRTDGEMPGPSRDADYPATGSKSDFDLLAKSSAHTAAAPTTVASLIAGSRPIRRVSHSTSTAPARSTIDEVLSYANAPSDSPLQSEPEPTKMSPLDLLILAYVERKLIRSGFDLQLPIFTEVRKAHECKTGETSHSERLSVKIMEKLLTVIPDAEELTCFQFLTKLFALAGKQGATDASISMLVKNQLSETVVKSAILIAKAVLERCPLCPEIAFPTAEIDALYDFLFVAMDLDLRDLNKAEIVFDHIVDMATAHHKSWMRSPASSTESCPPSSSMEGNATGKEVMRDQNDRQLIGNTRICEVLIEMLKAHFREVDVCVITCCAINDVTMQRTGFFQQYQDKFLYSGTAEVLIRALFVHKTNGTAIQSICCAIIGLIADNVRNTLYFRELGTFEVLVQVLRLHLLEVSVVERIIDAMYRVAQVTSKPRTVDGESLDPIAFALQARDQESIKSIRFKETGSCELIVNVLSRYKSNGSLASTVAKLMCIMSTIPEHALKLGQVDAIGELLEVLKLYISREVIEQQAAMALRQLLLYQENLMMIAAIGAGELLLKILLLHINAVPVTEKLCGVLVLMAGYGNNINKLGECGACLILVEVLLQHSSHTAIVRQACHALSYIAADADNQRRLIQHDLFSVLGKILPQHMTDPQIVLRVCRILCMIAIVPKAQVSDDSSDAVPKLLPERRELFLRHVPSRYANQLPVLTSSLTGKHQRHYFCNIVSLKRNQSLVPFSEVVTNSASVSGVDCGAIVQGLPILTDLQKCLELHSNSPKIVKSIREAWLLLSCLQ